MNRFFAVAVAVLMLGSSIFAQKMSLRPGAEIGLGFFSMNESYSGGSSSSDSRTGFTAGGVLEMNFNKYFSLQPGIVFSSRGGASSGDRSTSLNYIAIPVDAMGKYAVTPQVTVYGLAGINLGLLVGATAHSGSNDVDIKSNMNTMDFGIDLGVGGEYNLESFTPFLQLGWVLGIANIDAHAGSDESLKNGGFELKAGVKFPVK